MDRVGTVFIGAVNWFGRWRVLVVKMARTKNDQENTHTGIRADNWRELEAEARAFFLARVGEFNESAMLPCPRSLARRARWQQWAEQNITGKARH